MKINMNCVLKVSAKNGEKNEITKILYEIEMKYMQNRLQKVEIIWSEKVERKSGDKVESQTLVKKLREKVETKQNKKREKMQKKA